MTDAERRRLALLEGCVRELLRIHDAVLTCPTCVPPHEALEGEHLQQYRSITAKARGLVRA